MADPAPMIDNGQLAAILAAIVSVAGIIGGAIRWSVKRLTKALDDNTASNKADAEAKLTLAKEMAVLSERINRVAAFVEEHTPPPQEPPKPPRRKTPAYGTEYAYQRPKTRGGDDE